jgi:hypothetical protein
MQNCDWAQGVGVSRTTVKLTEAAGHVVRPVAGVGGGAAAAAIN